MWDGRKHCHGSRSLGLERNPGLASIAPDQTAASFWWKCRESMETAEVMQVWLPMTASQKLENHLGGRSS